ncbi:MAG: toll/interleukin-1 receptor domain-containing protein [Chromatiales bacterium]|nr:toll/interleukin-1 receptor domain-containing protein [Gammaproteobacteria bacterium]
MHRHIFLSWSGEESRKVAEALHRWLPHFIQLIDPWMSSTDILAGTRWQTEIASRLNECVFGIICVTPQNVESPWMLFETGALSKTIEASKVCPILLGVRVDQLPQALSQFQTVEADEHGIRSLLHALNDSLGDNKITDLQLGQAYAKFHEDLEKDLAEVRIDLATQREKRFCIFSSQVTRTQAIVKDLKALKDFPGTYVDRIYVRHSGFLSPFAISDEEIERNKKKHPDYYDALKQERDTLKELADDERFLLRCIVTPPTGFNFPSHLLKNTELRLNTLKAFLDGEGKELSIDWAISPFQQKNTYIIGNSSFFEGFKQGIEDGYRFTLRHAGPEEVEINIKMFDELYQRLAASTLGKQSSIAQLDERQELRQATLTSVNVAIKDIEKYHVKHGSKAAATGQKRTRNTTKAAPKRR